MGTGEGLILRGDSFDWSTQLDGSPHLSLDSAEKLLSKALGLYRQKMGQPPARVVVHKSSQYLDDERTGFSKALKDVPKRDFVAFGNKKIQWCVVSPSVLSYASFASMMVPAQVPSVGSPF